VVQGVQANLSLGILGETTLISPDGTTTKALFARIKPFTEKIDANSSQSASLSEIRDALLPKLVSGEIRVKDAEKMVGEKV